MPQIMIDTAGDSPRMLRFLANVIVQLAAELDAENAGEELPPLTPAATTAAPPPPAPPLPPTPPAQAFAAGTLPDNVTPIRPPVPPAPPAPPAAAAAAPVGNTSAQTDRDGYPWDKRIHSDPPKFNKDGTWRVRRGVDETTLTSVRASLRAAPAPTGTAAPSVPLPPSQTQAQIPPPPSAPATGETQGPSAAEAFAQNSPPSQVTPPAPPSPAAGGTAPVLPGAPAGAMTFQKLMQKIMVAIGQHKLTNDEVQAACKAGGADGLQALAAAPHLIDNVNVQIDTLLNRAR